MNLFSYGTLLDADVMHLVCGQTFPGSAARLDGFRSRKISGELYPAIVPALGEQVTGRLYFGLTAAALSSLDNYEGELYERCQVTVCIDDGDVVVAETYVLRAEYRHLLSNQMWCLDAFSDSDKAAYLKELK